MKNLEDLFKQQIVDLYSAENQFSKFLSKLEKGVHNEFLALAIQQQRQDNDKQLERLERIGEALDIEVNKGNCRAAAGLVEECNRMLNLAADDAVKDAGLIAQNQKIVHFEISGYGTAKHYANRLGFAEAEKALSESLSEHQDCDTNLNRIARRDINQKALVA